MPNKKKYTCAFALLFVLMLFGGASADYFWVVPSNFDVKTSGGFFVGLGAGHDYPRSTEFRTDPDALPKSKKDFIRYFMVKPDGSQKKLLLRSKMPVEYGNLVLGPVKLGMEGTVILAINAKTHYLTRTGEDWEKISKSQALEKGADRILASISFTTYGKTIVHRGAPGGEGFKSVLGQGLEIIPLQDPALVKPGEHFKLKVLYNGKPLAKEKIVYQVAQGKKRKGQNVTLTSKRGIARIKIITSGKYLVEIDHAQTNPSWSDCNERRTHSSITFFIK